MGKVSFIQIQNFCLNNLNFNLEKCKHSDKLKTVLVKFLVQMVAIKQVKDINRIISGKALRHLRKNTANIFMEAKDLYDKKDKKESKYSLFLVLILNNYKYMLCDKIFIY